MFHYFILLGKLRLCCRRIWNPFRKEKEKEREQKKKKKKEKKSRRSLPSTDGTRSLSFSIPNAHPQPTTNIQSLHITFFFFHLTHTPTNALLLTLPASKKNSLKTPSSKSLLLLPNLPSLIQTARRNHLRICTHIHS